MERKARPEWLYDGARVVLIADYPDDNPDLVRGCYGTFRGNFDYSGRPGIEWDNVIAGGHDCHRTAVMGHGWYVSTDDIVRAEYFEPAENEEEPPEYSDSEIKEFMLT